LEGHDLFGVVAEHLVEGDVTVFMSAGAEKARYITGIAVAINSERRMRRVFLTNIYDLARHSGENVTVAEY
jgi:hypothetical protein